MTELGARLRPWRCYDGGGNGGADMLSEGNQAFRFGEWGFLCAEALHQRTPFRSSSLCRAAGMWCPRGAPGPGCRLISCVLSIQPVCFDVCIYMSGGSAPMSSYRLFLYTLSVNAAYFGPLSLCEEPPSFPWWALF